MLQGYTTFSLLNSAEHDIYPANKCYSANNLLILCYSVLSTIAQVLRKMSLKILVS